MSIALLLYQRKGSPLQIILQRRKSEGPPEIRVVVQTPPANVGNVNSGPDFMLSGGPRNDVVQVHVILGLQAIALRAAAGERSENNDGGALIDARGGRMLTAKNDAELVQEFRRNHQAVVVVQLIFAVFSVDSGFGEDEAANSAILLRAVAVVPAKRASVIHSKLAGHAGREIRTAQWIGYVLLKQPRGSIGEHYVFKILLFAVHGNHKRRLAAVP